MTLLLLFASQGSPPAPPYVSTTQGGTPTLRTKGGDPTTATQGGRPALSTRGPQG